MFPINVSLFADRPQETLLRKQNLLPKKQKCFPTNSETFLLRKQCFLVCPHVFKIMFPTRETLFSRLGKFKKCLKNSANINNTLRFVRANVSQKMFRSLPTLET